MPLLRIASLALLLFTVGCASRPAVSFGIVRAGAMHETTRIPYKIGTSYGYHITFPEALGKVRIKEDFTLPGSAPWSSTHSDPRIAELKLQRTASGSHSLEEVEFDATAQSIFHSHFKIIPKDPRGLHIIRLWLNDQPLKTIKFTVE